MKEDGLSRVVQEMAGAAENARKAYTGKKKAFENLAKLWSVFLGTEICTGDIISMDILAAINRSVGRGIIPGDLYTSLAMYIARQGIDLDELEETGTKPEETTAKPEAKAAKKKAAARTKTDTKLTLPELQAKLQAGWSAAKIASYHGVTESYVYLLKKKLKAEQESAMKQSREVLDHMKGETDEQQGSSQSDV